MPVDATESLPHASRVGSIKRAATMALRNATVVSKGVSKIVVFTIPRLSPNLEIRRMTLQAPVKRDR
jgi:hypothetical protein